MKHFKLAFEAEEQQEGAVHVVGIDEVGRGPIAGPVYACCVELISPTEELLFELNDSKKLTPAKREQLVPRIKQCSLYGVGSSSAKVIDQIGIEQALALAAYDAYKWWAKQLPQPVEKVSVLLDGARDFMSELLLPENDARVRPLIKGDTLSASIMAASIIAKETRDALMREYDAEYPGYNFGQHSGYGTPAHIEALQKLGPSPIHRKWWQKAVKSAGKDD